MKHKILLSLLLLCGYQGQLSATENMYATVSAGYAKTEMLDSDNNNISYKLAVGHQFDRQWYLEVGMQKLVNDSKSEGMPDDAQLADNALKLDASALFIAWLGKASGRSGELFYRIGVLKTDIKGQQSLAGTQQCELGQASQINNTQGANFTFCQFDEGGVAGVIGLGFDYFVTSKAMLRSEIEYIKGQDNLTVSAAYVGLRYNF